MHYQDPVCQHWPEFCSSDDQAKAQLTIADVLRHEAGLQVLNQKINIEDCYPENIPTNNVGKVIEAQDLVYPHASK